MHFSHAASKYERQKFPILVGQDDRKTAEEYAAHRKLKMSDVEQRFAATGKLDCPWVIATANLVEKSNLIVTNAHVLLNRKGGRKGQPEKCRFIVNVDGKEKSVRLTSNYRAGHARSEKRDLQTKDWLVIRLKQSLPKLSPYRVFHPFNPLAPKDNYSSKKLWNVTAVAARHADWPTKNGRVIKDVMSIGECRVRDVSWSQLEISYKDVRAVRSDCDAGPGSSGGGYLLEQEGRYHLVGIVTGVNLNAKLGRHKYELGKHDARAILMSGAFLNAVTEMASQMSILEAQRGLSELGFQPGPVDGQMGEKTRRAIRAFEEQNEMASRGKITKEFSEKLSKALNE